MESSSSSAAASTSTSTSVMMAMKAEVGGSCAVGGESSEAAAAAAAAAAICGVNEDQVLMCRGIQLKKAKKERGCTAKERISKMPPSTAGKRSSIYRGVTRHRWTGRYEAHLWDKSTWNQNQNKKGKQVYLGAYDEEEAAARAYDLAALKYWGPGTLINFPVTDYTRDLDEMQNVSREEYLASLRRKSSGFSRGLAKYRGLSSRWDLSFGRMAGTDYFNSVHCGDHPTANNEYIGGLSIERKIDLTGYIKWWGHNKSRQAESSLKSSDETKRGCIEDVTRELKTLEGNVHASEPYQMPCLGTSVEKHERTPKMSAMSILSRSAAYRSLQEKEAEKHENNENENKNAIARVDHGKAIEKSTSHDNSCSEKVGLAHGMAEASSLQRNMYPLTPFLSAPLLTSYSSIDPLVDPILWASLAPGLHPGLSRNSEVTKTETSSTYTFFRPDE